MMQQGKKVMGTRRWVYLAALLGMLLMTKYFQGIRRDAVPDPAVGIEALRQSGIEYTRHAKCRMECRDISPEEIRMVLQRGRVNLSKCDPDDTPCPTYALEDRTADGQSVRIIFAACPDAARVVTAIDLDRDHDCLCD